jgi:hypothetical protein
MNQVLAVGLPLLSVILIAIGMVLRKRTARAVVPAVESAAGSATPTYTLTLSHEESRPADGISIASTGVLMRVETPSEGEPSIEALRERAWLAEQRERQATNALRHAMFPHFSRWLREKVFKTLIADRRRLLETQRHAASKVEKVEERLARVELQLQQQIAGYETRIEQLLRELSAAREENRGIILAHIAQLRQEIQATRARARAQQQAGRSE